MKTHTNGFKENLKKMGRELKGIITYGNTTLEDEIYAITPHYETNLLKSVMKQLDIESSVDISKETIVNCQIGILVGNNYEMLDYGNYVVYSSEKQEDTNTYKIICYDKMLYAMKQNQDLGVTYPITIKNYLIALANKIGLSVENTTFYNQDLTIPSELYLGEEYTYRDILDEIAQATGSIICINSSDKIEVRYPTETSDTIDEEYLKDINVTFKEKYGKINSIVLSRSGESDNVYLRDEESVTEDGLCEVKIVDNQIMNFNNRSDFLQGILNALDGLYYYINDLSSIGILYYDVGDLYNVSIGNNLYKCLMLNDEINVTTGIEELIHTDMPEQSKTDYSKADKTDLRINKTYLIVDKQNQTIESVVSNATEQNNKISQITQTVDEINSKIQDIVDITIYGESSSAFVSLTDINQSEPIMIKVHPTTTNISYLYPRSNLYPSDTLYMPNRTVRFKRTYDDEGVTKIEYIDYELPTDLLRYDSNTYDEFYLSYDTNTCQVTKRCQYNADGTVSALANPTTITYTYPQILLGDGDYEISLPGYDNGYLYVRLMAKNIYTTQFYTKVETNSLINQKTNEITLGVNQTLTNYSTTNQMNSAIDLKADQITNTVSNTYETKGNAQTNYSQLTQTANSLQSQINSNDSDISTLEQTAQGLISTVATKVGNTEVCSVISQRPEQIEIRSNRLIVDSNNFKLTNTGNLTCTNANVTGTITSSDATITGGKINISGSGTASDLIRVTNSSNSSEKSYIQPVGAGFIGSSGRIDIMAKGSSSSHSIINIEGSNTTEIRDNGITCPAIYSNTSSSSANLRIDNSGNFYRATGSSLRWKTDITENIENRLNPQQLYNLPIKQFKYKNNYLDKKDKRYGKNILGFIAEDVQKIYEPATEYDENGNVEMWNSDVMIPAMLKLIQEQHTEIKQMKKEINKLKGEKENE